jgi:hypothetical protein
LLIRETTLDSPEVERLIATWNDELGAKISARRPGERSRIAPAEFVPPGGVFLLATSDGAAVGCGGMRRLGVAAARRQNSDACSAAAATGLGAGSGSGAMFTRSRR